MEIDNKHNHKTYWLYSVFDDIRLHGFAIAPKAKLVDLLVKTKLTNKAKRAFAEEYGRYLSSAYKQPVPSLELPLVVELPADQVLFIQAEYYIEMTESFFDFIPMTPKVITTLSQSLKEKVSPFLREPLSELKVEGK